jgi:transglutaminase-like putative cysteine protease
MKNEKLKSKREKMRKSRSLCSSFFLFSLFSFLFLVLLAGCRLKTPVIHAIHPQIGTMGEPVTITGAFFGKEKNESYVTIAGVQPTNRSYLNWNDSEITLRIPELGEAGLIYVYVKGRKSNGMLFANQATVPVQVQGGETGAGPRIISVTPNAAAIGALVSISGTGFGSSRGNGGVFFPWNAQIPASAPAEARLLEFAEVSETDFGYELWTDREIRVRVPDGAAGGNMEIRTARGVSPPMVFDIAGRPGTKTLGNKRSYTISYSVNVKVSEAKTPNTLYLWIPHPSESSSQRNRELLLSSMEPFVENYRGVGLYKIDNMTAHSDAQIRLSWKVDVYSVETAVQPPSIRVESNSPISEAYTQNILSLPSDDSRIKDRAAAIMGRERNPYLKAQRVYDWMVTGGELTWENQSSGDILSVLQTKRTDAYLAALLYCTLLRSAGVPCQPVAGVLVSRNRQTMNHYWAEFWVDGFGWIPVDPAMGAGAVPAPFAIPEEKPNFYFGNIDSQRIAFSRGFTILSPMDPHGRTVAHSRSYSLQNLREEVVGGIESYSSLWGDITITGIYVQ